MKLLVIFVCACVVGSLGSIVPAKTSVDAVAGFGKLGEENRMKTSDNVRDVSKSAKADQKWVSEDTKKGAIDQDWEQQSKTSGSDAMSKAQAHRQQAAKFDQNKDASQKAASKSSHASNDKSAFDKLAKSSNFDQNQAWASNDGFRKKNRNHEGISYSFDKNFQRNANENGGFKAGNSLDKHALDDNGHRRSSYDRVAGDHAAQAARGDRQSADRNHGHGANAWANAGSWDKFGRDYRKAEAARGNNRDWAEKNDRSNNFDGYNADENARAVDTFSDRADVDRNAERASAGFGATSQGLYGKGAGVVAPVGLGYNRYPVHKVVGDVGLTGKGYNLAKGGADTANVWDRADRRKQQASGAAALQDRAKQSQLANQWQEDQIKGFNRNQGALLDNNGFARDGNSRASSAQSANRQWADANAAKGAQQAKHDMDEVARLRDNAAWNRSDRDSKVNEYKKFFNNDKKGGQNWERLKYNKDQTQDTAAGDFANKKDVANKWQDSRRYDARDQAARSAETARARDAANRAWSQDHIQNADAAQRQAAQAQDAANRGAWASSNDRRKSLVDQARLDARNQGAMARDGAAWRQDVDARGVRGAGSKNVYAGRGSAFPAHSGYGAYSGGYGAYPAGYGYGGNAVYSNGRYPAYNNGYGAGYGAGYGPGYGFGAGAYGNKFYH